MADLQFARSDALNDFARERGLDPLEPSNGSGGPDSVTAESSEADALERKGRRWLIWSFILCPCHLPWTMAILAAILGGSGVGAFVNQYRTGVGIAIAVLYFAGVAVGFHYLRQAKAKGACNVRF